MGSPLAASSERPEGTAGLARRPQKIPVPHPGRPRRRIGLHPGRPAGDAVRFVAVGLPDGLPLLRVYAGRSGTGTDDCGNAGSDLQDPEHNGRAGI